MGPTWVLSAPNWHHVGPMNLAIWDSTDSGKESGTLWIVDTHTTVVMSLTDTMNRTAESSVIGIDTKIEVIVVSPTTWEAHHSPRAKPEGCGELPRSLVTPQWPKSGYQFLFYHDASKHIKSMHIRVCISRKSLIKLLQNNHYGRHGHRTLSQQLP